MSDAHGHADAHAHHERAGGDHGTSKAAQSDHNDLDVGAIAFIFLVGTVSVIAIVLALQVMYYFREDQLIASRQTALVNDHANEIFAQQRAKQQAYAIDGETHVVRIPIDAAMELTVKDLAGAPREEQPKQQQPPQQEQPKQGGSGARRGF